MIESFTIATVPLSHGARIGICRLPGRSGDLAGDMAAIVAWRPAYVVSMTTSAEMETLGAAGLSKGLEIAGIRWRHFPIVDFGAPRPEQEEDWKRLSVQLHQALDEGLGVLTHCQGGHGRSGMATLRLLTERGENPAEALARMRLVRPGAVETAAQTVWASVQA